MRNEIANFRNCKSIAIMGGTFDPIHYGHLVTAEAVRHRFHVDKVVFIPTGRPAHKSHKEVTHNEHRYLMTVLATMRNENFEVSRIEIDRPGTTYTIDTIEQLKKMCRPDVRLYFITGADAIHQIMSWKEPERLLSLCDFVAVTRPGYQKNQMFEEIGEIQEKYASRIHYMEVPALAISSSDIRTRAQRGMPIQYLLPQEVEDYIHKFGLYQNERKDEVKFMLPIEVMQEKLQSALSVKRYIHTMGVSEEAVRLAEIYGTQADRQKAKVAGLLHDIGKIGIPESILKKKGKLTDEEYEVMKTHVENSIEMIHFLPNMNYVIPAVLSHHERYDGKGYPGGVKGTDIPILVRILAVCDSFDAMVSRRAYKDALSVEYAIGELEKGKGTQFDPDVAEAFIELIEEDPSFQVKAS